MATFSQGGTLGTAIEESEIVDGSVTPAKQSTGGRVDTYLKTATCVSNKANFGIDLNATLEYGNYAYNVNTEMTCSQTVIPFYIAATQVSFWVTNFTAGGTLKISLYTIDGGTRLFSVTSGTISATGLQTVSLGGTVNIPGGVYYLAIVSTATTNVGISAFSLSAFADSTMWTTAVTGKAVPCGKVTVTAGTPPATITPTTLTAALICPVVRFDA